MSVGLYKEITGQEMPKYYRPPQGKYSQGNLAMAKELGREEGTGAFLDDLPHAFFEEKKPLDESERGE